MFKPFIFLLSILAVTNIAVFSNAQAAAFSSGNQFTVHNLYGNLTVTCRGGAIANYECRDSVLEPTNFDYLIGPTNPNSNRIDLNILYAAGGSRSLRARYDGKSGKSIDGFNLWSPYLFQKPILREGLNIINYVLYNNNQSLEIGEFQVSVDRGNARLCPKARIESNEASDCQAQYSACQRYFEYYRYCN